MEDVTKSQARQRAIKDALRQAVEEVAGVNVRAETLIMNFQTAGDIIKAIPCGKILEKKILKEEIKTIQQEGCTEALAMYWVKIKARVAKENGNPDPFFNLELALNRNSFISGEDAQISVKSTRDCFVFIFVILDDQEGQKVIQLIPNKYHKDNFIKADDLFIFPQKKDRDSGIRLVPRTPPGKKHVTETIYAMAFKQRFSFNAGIQEGIFGKYNGKTAFIEELIQDIVQIPLSDRAEAFAQYEIVAEKEEETPGETTISN